MKYLFNFFDLILRNFISFFSYHFSEILTEAALGRIICKCLYWNLRKKWRNDESARPSTLLKLESTTNIFIDQVHRLLLFYKKACILRTYAMKCAHDSSKSTSIEAYRNTESIDLYFQFPKYRLFRCIKLSFY